MKNKQCKLFPVHAYVGGVVCIGCIKNGRVVVDQCESVELCLQKLYKDDHSKLRQKINEARSIKQRIDALDGKYQNKLDSLLNFDNAYINLITYFDEYDNFILTGGRASGKSFSSLKTIICLILRRNIKIACLLTRGVSCQYKDLALKFIEEYSLEMNWDFYFKEVTNPENNSEINFIGHIDDLNYLKKYDVIYCDNAEELTFESATRLKKFALENNIKLILNITGILAETPVYEVFMTARRNLVMKATYKDNKYCPQAICDFAEEDKKRLTTDDFNKIWLGE